MVVASLGTLFVMTTSLRASSSATMETDMLMASSPASPPLDSLLLVYLSLLFLFFLFLLWHTQHCDMVQIHAQVSFDEFFLAVIEPDNIYTRYGRNSIGLKGIGALYSSTTQVATNMAFSSMALACLSMALTSSLVAFTHPSTVLARSSFS